MQTERIKNITVNVHHIINNYKYHRKHNVSSAAGEKFSVSILTPEKFSSAGRVRGLRLSVELGPNSALY